MPSGAKVTLTAILLTLRQLFPERENPERQLRQVVGAFLQVAQGEAQATHKTGSIPALARPKSAVNSLDCWVAACLAMNPEAQVRQDPELMHFWQFEGQVMQLLPSRKDPSKQLRQTPSLPEVGLQRAQLLEHCTQEDTKFTVSMLRAKPKGQLVQVPFELQSRSGSQFWEASVLNLKPAMQEVQEEGSV